MFKELIEIVRVPRPEDLAKAELMESQRELLKAHSGLEHAEAMVGYHSKRVARLTKFVEVANG